MNDRARCDNKQCPSFDNCYRAQAPRNELVWIENFDNGRKVKCDFFIEYNEPNLEYLCKNTSRNTSIDKI